MANKYDSMDAAILAHIEGGAPTHPMKDAGLRDAMKALRRDNRPPCTYIGKRLQALRKAGLIVLHVGEAPSWRPANVSLNMYNQGG